MKKILIMTAVMLITAFVSSQAYAGLVLNTTNSGSFRFDPSGTMGGENFTVAGDNGLNDMAIYLGYRTGTFGNQSTEIIQLTAGSPIGGSDAPNGVFSNLGSYNFNPISFSNGVTVDALANFRLTDATGSFGDPDTRAHVLYDLELTTDGVDGNTEGSLLSFVGFDFNGNGGDSIQGTEVIPGFGNSEISVGATDRVLYGDFTFAAGQGGATVATSNTNLDAFNGLIGSNLNARFNGVTDSFTNGNLGFGAYSDFEGRDVDRTDTTSGVFGFRSVSTIPEPSTLMMAAMGLGMVAFRRRRKQA